MYSSEEEQEENEDDCAPVNPFEVKKTTMEERKKSGKKGTSQGFYDLLANKKKKKTQNATSQDSFILNSDSLSNEKGKSESIYPRDISLKSSVRILSPISIPWFSSSFTDVRHKTV